MPTENRDNFKPAPQPRRVVEKEYPEDERRIAVAKRTPGGVDGYEWTEHDEVLDIPEHLAIELLSAPHAGFYEPTPTTASVEAQEVAQDKADEMKARPKRQGRRQKPPPGGTVTAGPTAEHDAAYGALDADPTPEATGTTLAAAITGSDPNRTD